MQFGEAPAPPSCRPHNLSLGRVTRPPPTKSSGFVQCPLLATTRPLFPESTTTRHVAKRSFPVQSSVLLPSAPRRLTGQNVGGISLGYEGVHVYRGWGFHCAHARLRRRSPQRAPSLGYLLGCPRQGSDIIAGSRGPPNICILF